MGLLDRLVPRPGLRVLIPAGASGIGAAIASAFAEAGAALHVCDVNEEALAVFRTRLPQAEATLADVGDLAQIEQVFARQRERFGGLDVLVNNAGIAGPTAGIDAITDEDWQRTTDINLTAQYRFATRAVPLLKQSDAASIICMSSVAGRLGYAWRTPYAATKWAIIGLVKSLAAELGPDDIRVNALLPGVVEGPRIEGVISARARQLDLPVDEMRRQYIERVSLRRMVTGEDVALMALFLCSPAGRNISGQAISVDGNVEYL